MQIARAWSRVGAEGTDAARAERESRRNRIVRRAYLLGGLALVGWLCAFHPGIAVTRIAGFVAFAAAAATVAGCVVNRDRRQAGWLAVAVALLLIGSGDLVWAAAGPPPDAPDHVPSAVDVAYLLGYVTLMAALFRLAGERSSGRDVARDIDVGIVALGLGLVTWLVMVERVLDVPGGRTSAGPLVPLAYGASALMLAAILARMLFDPTRASRSVRFLELGVLVYLVSDVLYVRAAISGTWSTGSPIDAGWLAGYLLLGAASLHPSSVSAVERAPAAGLSFGRGASLVTACLVVPAALLWSWWFRELEDLPIIAAVSALVSLLWTARVRVSVDRLRRSLDERRALEGRLREQAMSDPLVGLPNRTSFEQRLAILAGAGLPIAVLYLDIDDFKDVNDSLGHAAGDAVLVQVARRLAEALRTDDLAARLGGDEFGVIVRDADAAAAQAVARRVLGALRAPFLIEGRRVHVHGSIGISLAAGGKLPADIMREADVAMYLAKEQGKGRYQVFEKEMHARVMGRIALRAELEQAIANGEFELHYQPIVTVCRRTVFACEALVRWRHPGRGLLEPAEFIGLAEETGLIVPLGQWIFEEACREAVRWAEAGGERTPAVTVNVSAVQLHQPTFYEDLVGAMNTAGVDPGQLILELTESTLLDDDEAKAILPALRRLGVRIALDDFGTGYSSLAYLADYPIDMLKIDRAFVAALGTGARDDRLAAAIINLSHDLRISVIAEGVETDAQLDRLTTLGCGWIQGWLISRALPAAEIERLIEAWPERPVGSLTGAEQAAQAAQEPGAEAGAAA